MFATSVRHDEQEAPAASAGIRTAPSSLEHQIQLYLGQHRLGEAMDREELAQMEGLQRALTLRNGVICGQIAYVHDRPRADATLAVLTLIAFLCDNNDGLCCLGARRMAEIFHRDERNIRDTIDRLEAAGRIGVNRPAGLPMSYWIVIPAIMAEQGACAMSFVQALSAKKTPRWMVDKGRQSLLDTPDADIRPTPDVDARGTPRMSSADTPDVDIRHSICTKTTTSKVSEEPASHAAEDPLLVELIDHDEIIAPANVPPRGKRSASATSLKRERSGTGKRKWAWLPESEQRALFEQCRAYAAERAHQGWTPEFLVERLRAFSRHQEINGPASANWGASLEQWLSDARFQPRATRAKASAEDIAAQAFGGMSWERS